MIEIKFIGTSSAIVEEERFHSQILLKSRNYNLLFDAPDCTTKALLKFGEAIDLIDGIVITHFHPDHISGLATLIQQMKLYGRRKNLEIFVHSKSKKQLIRLLASTYIFFEKIDFPIEIITINENERKIVTENIGIIPIVNRHITNKNNLKYSDVEYISLSFFIETKFCNIVFTSDISSEDELFVFPESNVKFYITEFTHIDFSSIVLAYKKYKPEKLLITHYENKSILETGKNIEEIIFAKDGETFPINNKD